MENLSAKIYTKKQRKIKILQFGEGNFLRAFIEYIIQGMNDKGVFCGGVAVVQPLKTGRVKELADQDGLYTLYLEGIENGKPVSSRRVIDVLEAFVNPYENYGAYLELAKNPDLKIVISNTTEAGIALEPDDTDFTVCPNSFPAKLLAFLQARYKHFKGNPDAGLAIIPCELIDYNGTELKRVLNEMCKLVRAEAGFVNWLNESNHFTNTLVDRIVPGYPGAEIERIRSECGYIDNSVVKGEVFHLWVLEQNSFIQNVFPADKCGLNVIFAPDITPYKQRKVKILNGSHTALVPVAYLCGFDTVGESVNDPCINRFLKGLIFEEINPTIKLPKEQMDAFASSVLERYQNPYIRHELMSIALNSTTKFRTRLLPTLTDYLEINRKLPNRLLFAFAALILFHAGKRGNSAIALKDDQAFIKRWEGLWNEYGSNPLALTGEACDWNEAWGMNLALLDDALVKTVAGYLELMINKGMRAALEASF